MRTNETPIGPSGSAFDYLIRWERNGVFTRFPCLHCDGWTEKQDPLAVAYAAGREPLTADATGGEAGMVCDQCVEAGPEPVARRLIAQAKRLERMATESRRTAQLRWSFPSAEERPRLEAEAKAEGAAYDAVRTREEA